MTAATYREVMLDWAVAELMSPHWRTVTNWVWAEKAWDPWRAHVFCNGPVAWTPEQEATLLKAIETSRAPVISRYGPRPNWRIERQCWTPPQLAALQVMPDFFPPGGTLFQLAQWIAATPDYAPEKNAAIRAMIQEAGAGRQAFGSLVAVQSQSGARTLIEGYKRAMAAMAIGRQDAPVFLCWET